MKLAALALTALTAFTTMAPAAQAGLANEFNLYNDARVEQNNSKRAQCDALKSQVNFQTGFGQTGFAVHNGQVQSYRGNKGDTVICWMGDKLQLGVEYTTWSKKVSGQKYQDHMFQVESGILFQYVKRYYLDGTTLVMKKAVAFNCPQQRVDQYDPDTFNSVGSRNRGGNRHAECRSTGIRYDMGVKAGQGNGHTNASGSEIQTRYETNWDFTDYAIRRYGR